MGQQRERESGRGIRRKTGKARVRMEEGGTERGRKGKRKREERAREKARGREAERVRRCYKLGQTNNDLIYTHAHA